MSCRFDGKVGDKGQRFEIRYNHITHAEPSPGVFVEISRAEKVLGWANDLTGAKRMLEAFQSAPYAEGGRIIDREALTPRKLAALLLALPAEDQDKAIAIARDSQADEYFSIENPGDGTAWDNATNVGRTPDGRIAID